MCIYLKKDNIRDYATEAFRYYAKTGKTAEEIRNDIGLMLLESRKKTSKGCNIGNPTECVVMKKEQLIIDLRAEIDDIEAVDRTLMRLRASKDRDAIKAIEIVYFTEPNKELEKNDISYRVQKAMLTIPCSDRTVYYILSRVRRIFAEERGLRIN